MGHWTMYDVEAHVAEIYDQSEAYDDDVQLIRRLVAGRGGLRILEPFCGTGRILIPLAADGHCLVGLDRARCMLGRARAKLAALPAIPGERATLMEANVLADPWPRGFDVVLLGGNCLYELATPEEQEGCIARAAASVREGGHVYVDNNHTEGDLAEDWREPGVRHDAFPTGVCADGTRIESSTEAIWWDAARRLGRYRRHTTVTLPDGRTVESEYVVQDHAVSYGEVISWLEAHGLVIEHVFGDRAGHPYSEESGRVIFWARKR